jgi:hypothetical protein
MWRKADPKRLGSRLGSRAVFIAAASLVWGVGIAHAQDLEPRAYSASPTDTNFVTSGFTDTSGTVSLDPSLPITGVKAAIDTYSIGYNHTFGLLGRSASAAIVVPYISGELTGQVYTQNQRVTRSGWGDVRIRLALNLLGGPALTPAEFMQRQQTTTLGVSLIVIAPTGQYDPQRLVNISSHRWAFKPEIGLSQPLGNWFAEAYAGAWIFTDNDDHFQGPVFSQDPFYTFQVLGGYNFRPGLWLTADATYYTGGRTSTDDVPADNYQVNSRYGLTLSVPLVAGVSIKLTWSKLLTGHIGANYQTIGIALQYRWFGWQEPQEH